MARRKILVLENEYLLSAGLHSLLSKHEDLEVLNTKFTSRTKLLPIIDALQPDVIVTDEEGLSVSGGKLEVVMKERPKLRIIIALWEDNQIVVYDSYRIVIKGIEDFLAVI